MYTIFDALTMLRPFDIDVGKIRIGPAGDGGYVVANRLSPEQTVLSYGISEQYGFDEEMAHAGHRVLMFDHTIDIPTLQHSGMEFFREGCAAKSDGESLFSVTDHLEKNNVVGDQLILKMDVEGAEFDTILAIPQDVLRRFEQILVEVHFLADLEKPEFRERFCRFMSHLNRYFTIFHVHANNFDGPDEFSTVGGMPTVNLIELSFMRSNVVDRWPSSTVYPTHLDFPNGEPRDKLLWCYPYFPTSVGSDAYGAVWARTTL